MPRTALGDQQLTVELERLTLSALRAVYDDLNQSFFKGSLRRPVFELTGAPDLLGRWSAEHRAIEISRTLLVQHGWGSVVEVLKHEMAHQFVDEALGIRERTAHGPEFRRVCQERGFDPGPKGVPRNSSDQHAPEQARVLERVAKLLALAESSNVHEAEAAMNAAQRLMLKYNLEHVTRDGPRDYVFRHLGVPTGRVSESERLVAVILTDHFFVQSIWVPVWRPLAGKRGSVLEICGSLENVEMAEYVHSFLSHTAEQLWSDHKRLSGTRRNSERRTFLAGVMSGFRERLAAEKRRAHAAGLIWVGDGDLDRYFRQRHPHVRWARYGGSRRSETYARGREAGQRIVLHRGVHSGPTGQRALLPPKRG